MPTREQVFEVADALLADGIRPSRRLVRDGLRHGGSPRVILEHLQAWRKARGCGPDLEPREVPERLQGRLAEFAGDMWRTALADAAQAWQREREALEVVRRDEAEDREHLLGLLEEAETRIAGLDARLAEAVEEASRLRSALAKTSKSLSDSRAEAFWDRVMQEVHAILPPNGEPMTADEILAKMTPWTARGSSIAKESLTAGTLREKMKVRARYGRYLRLLDDGRAARPV